MKRLKELTGIFLLLVMVGCSTPNRTAYVTLGSIATLVNTSLKVYNEFYQAGKSDEITRNELKVIYERYQVAARVAEVAQKNLNNPTSTHYQHITAVVQSAADEVINYINTHTKE